MSTGGSFGERSGARDGMGLWWGMLGRWGWVDGEYIEGAVLLGKLSTLPVGVATEEFPELLMCWAG